MRREDFERLYEEHAQPLFGFLSYRTGNRALTEDLVADTFERALRSRRRFDPRKGTEKAWLYTIALNCLRDHQRRTKTAERAIEHTAAASSASEPASGPDQVDSSEELSRALAALSSEEREAVALRYGGDLTVPEVAEVLGEPLQRIEGRVYRALRKLREELS